MIGTRVMRAVRSAQARLLVIALGWGLGTGCVYYNGIYNARAAARAGDARLRDDDEGEAANQFRIAAEKAETVLARHPRSKWRPAALYLAGRGAAYASACERAVPRLDEFLRGTAGSAAERARARLALGICDVRQSRLPTALARLDSLVESPDRAVAREARLWAARGALAAGDRETAARYAATLDAGALQWELLNVSLAANELARVETLLVQRAARGDYREDVVRSVRALHAAGAFDAVERIAAGYDAARIRDASRASLHFAMGDLYLRAGLDSLASPHLFTAQSLAGRDTTVEREARARLALLALPRMSLLRELDSAMARQDSVLRRTAYSRRTSEQLLLLRMLETADDPTGAGVYLAAEVARDSLRAPSIARALFLRVAREIQGSPLAPNAWYAASLLLPDSAPAWTERVVREYPGSSLAARLRGEDPAQRPDFVSSPELLRGVWTLVTRRWTDSVRVLRTPPRAATTPPPPPAQR